MKTTQIARLGLCAALGAVIAALLAGTTPDQNDTPRTPERTYLV
jgi:hypothetical protein